MITSRPIRFTDHLDQHRRILEALGATVVTDHGPDWVVYALGSGRLALHAADATHPSGLTVLGFEVDDLADLAAAVTPGAFTFEIGELEHGRAATVTGPDGTRFTVDPIATAEHPAAPGPLAIMPIWYTQETPGARATLTGIGARERIVADSGTWTDMICPGGGLVAVHAAAEVGVELAYAYAGDVEELAPALARVGVETTLIDETYARTLRVPDPDRDAEIWINEKQTDLYGYSLAAGSPASEGTT